MNGARAIGPIGLFVAASACAPAMERPQLSAAAVTELALLGGDGVAVPLPALYGDKDALVLVFWSSECPCVRRYQDRVDALIARYPSVRVIGVSSNAGETSAQVDKTVSDRGVKLPIWRDEGGRVAAVVGARTTPTIAIIDSHGALRYLGWLDNERLPGERGREAYVDSALAALLAHAPVVTTRSPIFGCVITRSLAAAEAASCAAPPANKRSH